MLFYSILHINFLASRTISTAISDGVSPSSVMNVIDKCHWIETSVHAGFCSYRKITQFAPRNLLVLRKVKKRGQSHTALQESIECFDFQSSPGCIIPVGYFHLTSADCSFTISHSDLFPLSRSPRTPVAWITSKWSWETDHTPDKNSRC